MRNIEATLIIFTFLFGMVACLPIQSTSQPEYRDISPSETTFLPGTLSPTVKFPQDSTDEPLFETGAHMALRPEAQPILMQLETAPRYILDLEVDYEHHRFNGRAYIEYINNEDANLDRLYFRLFPNGKKSYGNGSLVVDNIHVNNEEAIAYYSLNDSAFEIPLETTLAPGAHLTVDIGFHGQVPEINLRENQPGYGIYSFSEDGMVLSGWFPMLAVYNESGWNLDPVYEFGDSVFSDVALFEVRLVVPADLVVASSGVQTHAEESDGKMTRYFSSGPARDFTLVLSPNFLLQQTQADGITINSYTLPGHEAAGQIGLETVTGALKTFEEFYGAYPYNEFDLVEVPLRYASGVEYPGLALIKRELYNDPQDTAFTGTIAHEVAHQWWYNVVGNDVIDEPWLDEALCNFSLGLYLEKTGGESMANGFYDYLQQRYENSLVNGEGAPVTESLAFFEALGNSTAYSGSVYGKGALFFKELRQRVGDEAFFNALQTYYQEYYFGIADRDALLEVFERTSETQLDDFYQEWLTLPVIQPTPTPIPTQAGSVNFAVIGDYGSGDENALAVSNLVHSWQPDFIITVGDNNYPNGSVESIDTNIGQFYSDYIAPYHGKYGKGSEQNRFFPVLGNHDWYSNNAQAYLDYFSLPGNERYYDFTWGVVHFFALDATFEEPDGIGRSKKQATWLKERLAASTAPWKVVYGHVPAYSSGEEGWITAMRWPFKQWGASIYLSGHDHDYERLEVDGFPYIVNGLGGGAIYNFKEILPESLVRFNDGYGALLVTANENQMTFQFITVEGVVVDTFTITKP